MKTPKPGDVVYVDSARYLWHAADDFCGGKATVTRVIAGIIPGDPEPHIEVAENPGTLYNWELLAAEQAKLSAKFGDAWAHPDPDLSPEFNDLWAHLDLDPDLRPELNEP